MKKFFITTLLVIALGSMTEMVAQVHSKPALASGSIYDHNPHQQELPYLQEPTRSLDDYLNNNHPNNGNSNQGTSSHSGSSHNARSSSNNQSNQNNNPHTGTSNRNNRNSSHR